MTVDYDRRIVRAEELASVHPESSELLHFYSGLARIQRDIYTSLRSSGETDVAALARFFPTLIDYVGRSGPGNLAVAARQFCGEFAVRARLLGGYWGGEREGSAEEQFFARALLQPYAEAGASPCPFCNAKPVAAVLRGEGDGAKRSLICSMCSSERVYRRVVCPNCGEEDKDRLPIYIAEQADYIRVDACDTCKTYLKSVDLTKNGRAVPVVDELATVALNIWAEEHGYVKIEPNLLGM
jgi:FdhE protein